MPKGLAITLLFLAGLLALYLGTLAFLWWRQERLLFYPEPLPASYPLATAPDIHERTVAVAGAQLSVLQLKVPDAKGVVFYLHGNAGNLARWFSNADFYRAARFDLVMPDYRGYGKSTGAIAGVEQLRADMRAVWDAFAGEYRGKRIVVFGRSLGTALAADLAEQLSSEGHAPQLTVLVSPYSSLRELTAEFYPWVPGALLRYPLDTGSHLPGIRGTVLLVHGEDDALIALRHSRHLQQVLPSARLLVVPGAGHNDVHEFALYRQVLGQALDAL
ncbi:alpha/beta hydrolase [Ramlibacter sp. AN1133]|uniref:alpha/beta hydrolase n=1 Tax=Ramlibacter sp. AN1133 TaxID=3133429 RepID=UPI0030BEBAA5